MKPKKDNSNTPKKVGKPVGRPAHVNTYKIEQITISKSCMETLNIFIYEALILDVIYQYQKQEKVVKGFCLESKKQIGADLQCTEITVIKYLDSLEDAGLISRNQNILAVTQKYLLALVPASNMQE